MTKETKIGLLVGLAFIILFAIILSEKGATSREAVPPSFAVVDASKNAAAATGAEKPLHDAGRLPVESKLPPVVRYVPQATEQAMKTPDTSEPLGRPLPDGNEDLPPLPESLVKLLNEPVREAPKPQVVEEPSGETPSVSLGEAVAMALESNAPKTEPQAPDASRDKPSNTAPAATNASPATPVAAVSPETARLAERPVAPSPQVIKTVHEVQPGESIGKIAAKYYGRSTPARIQAIVAANRGVIDDVNKVRARDKLKIPALTESGAFEPAPAFVGGEVVAARTSPKDDRVRIPVPIGERGSSTQARRGTSADSRSPARTGDATSPVGAIQADSTPSRTVQAVQPAFEYYVVQEKDTLSRIAKRKLGDERYYLELYRLNRDVLQSKDVLKPGQKIRLPIKSSARPATDTVLSALPAGFAEP